MRRWGYIYKKGSETRHEDGTEWKERRVAEPQSKMTGTLGAVPSNARDDREMVHLRRDTGHTAQCGPL